jgi:UDP-glucose 4-epimerase
MSKKTVITGAAGFLGSHLADTLLDRGHQVIALDNLSMGKQQNFRHNLSNPKYTFYQCDVCNQDDLLRICEGANIIVHLAAYKIPRYGKSIDTLLINCRGTENVLTVARAVNAKVVLASTSDVYGKNEQLPFSEESDHVLGPSTVARWGYAVSKLFDEHLALAFQEAYNTPITILRFFGSYGPRHHLSWWGGPQSVFISQILRGEPLTIHGDGSQTRTFTYVNDTVAGIVASMEYEQAHGGIFNIGNTEEISILELAHLIKRLCEVPGELRLEFIPYNSFTGKAYEDVRRRIPDISKAKQLLGYEPKITLRQGLQRTIDWQKKALIFAPISN